MLLQIGKNIVSADVFQAFDIKEYSVSIQGLPYPVIVRLGEKDQRVFESIFIRNEYDALLPSKPDVIVDAGANVGYSVLWYLARFPNARIFALEPDPNNLDVLHRNCDRYPNVTILPYALWGEIELLDLQFKSPEGKRLNSWGTRTVKSVEGAEPGAGQVQAVTLDWLMAAYQLPAIDILKVDVEGAEKEIFESPARGWLSSVGVIATEFHDRFKPGCSQALRDALQGEKLREYRRGENWFFQILRN